MADYDEKATTPPYGYNGSDGAHDKKTGSDDGVKVTTLESDL